jgi:hypothetical protein
MDLPPILLEGDEPSTTPESTSVPPHAGFAGEQAWTKAALEESDSLPEAYGTGKLCLLARDPDCIYAHWDLSLEQQHQYNTLSTDRHLVLRVFVEEKRGTPFKEIHLHPESQSWFVYVDSGGSAYVAELGYYAPGGEWVSMADSEPISPPPATMSSEQEVRFATVQPSEFPGFQPPPEESRPSPALATAVACRQVESPPDAPSPMQAEEYMAPAAAPSEGWFPWKAAGNGETLNELLDPLPRSPLITHEEIESVYGAGSEVEWTETQELALDQILTTTTRVWEATNSLENVLNAQKALEKELAAVAAVQKVQPHVEAPRVPDSVLDRERPDVISSEVGQPPQSARDFWFTVNAELVVYGATDPTASVTIGEHRIRLRTDGTFSYRFALPDGYYELPITAASVDDDQRHVTLTFRRDTVFRGEVGKHPQDPALRPPAVKNLA